MCFPFHFDLSYLALLLSFAVATTAVPSMATTASPTPASFCDQLLAAQQYAASVRQQLFNESQTLRQFLARIQNGESSVTSEDLITPPDRIVSLTLIGYKGFDLPIAGQILGIRTDSAYPEVDFYDVGILAQRRIRIADIQTLGRGQPTLRMALSLADVERVDRKVKKLLANSSRTNSMLSFVTTSGEVILGMYDRLTFTPWGKVKAVNYREAPGGPLMSTSVEQILPDSLTLLNREPIPLSPDQAALAERLFRARAHQQRVGFFYDSIDGPVTVEGFVDEIPLFDVEGFAYVCIENGANRAYVKIADIRGASIRINPQPPISGDELSIHIRVSGYAHTPGRINVIPRLPPPLLRSLINLADPQVFSGADLSAEIMDLVRPGDVAQLFFHSAALAMHLKIVRSVKNEWVFSIGFADKGIHLYNLSTGFPLVDLRAAMLEMRRLFLIAAAEKSHDPGLSEAIRDLKTAFPENYAELVPFVVFAEGWRFHFARAAFVKLRSKPNLSGALRRLQSALQFMHENQISFQSKVSAQPQQLYDDPVASNLPLMDRILRALTKKGAVYEEGGWRWRN